MQKLYNYVFRMYNNYNYLLLIIIKKINLLLLEMIIIVQ